MTLYEMVVKNNRVKSCVVLDVKESSRINGSQHFITKLEYNKSIKFLHTTTCFCDDEGRAARICNDIYWSLIDHMNNLSCYLEECPSSSIQTIHKSTCILCGAPGDDLVIKFYCSNNGCKNYHP